MGIVITREDGMEYTLPDALALDTHELNVDVPGIEVPRKHGQMKFDREKTAGPRQLRMSGTFYQVTRDQANAFAEQLAGILFGGGDLRLRRSSTSNLTIWCAPKSMDRDYHRGSFGGAVFSLQVTLEALDPWWYGPPVSVAHTTAASGETWTVNHPGSDVVQPVIVYLSPVSATLVNPQISMVETGAVALYTGSLGINQVLILDGEQRQAWVEDWSGVLIGGAEDVPKTNVTGQLSATFQASGLWVIPGVNTVRYTDSGGGIAQVEVEWIPRSW